MLTYLSTAESLKGGLVTKSVFARLHNQSQTRVDALLGFLSLFSWSHFDISSLLLSL
jgi:hypothetical protein